MLAHSSRLLLEVCKKGRTVRGEIPISCEAGWEATGGLASVTVSAVLDCF